MLIQDALDKTGKATRKGFDWFLERCQNGEESYRAIDLKSGGVIGYEIAIRHVFAGDWQPYHEVKEIRPEKEGELWKNNVGINWFIKWVGSSRDKGLHAVSEQGVCFDVKGLDMIHGKNGWTRLFPKVEDESVERTSIECTNCGLKANLYGINNLSHILKLTCSCCGKVIPKETS